MRRFVLAAQIVERECERAFHQATDFQAPVVLFNRRRNCVDVNPVVLFEWRELRARTGRGFNFCGGVRQGVIGRPAFTLYDFSLAPADDEGADNRADYSDDGGCPTQPDQESAAINSCGLRRAYRSQTPVTPTQNRAPDYKSGKNPDRAGDRAGSRRLTDAATDERHRRANRGSDDGAEQ